MKVKERSLRRVRLLLLLVFFLFKSGFIVGAVDTSELTDFLYLDFEEVRDVRGNGSWYNDGVFGSNGSMYLKTVSDYSSVAFPAFAEGGTTKALSVCLKHLNGPEFGKIQLIFYHNVIRSNGEPTTDMKAFEVVELIKEMDLDDGWSKYSKIHTFSTTSRWRDIENGDTGNNSYPKASGECTVEVRVNASGVEYLTDELIIDPIWNDDETETTVLYGGFNNDIVSEGFTSEGNAVLSYIDENGANGTSGYLKIDCSGNNSGVRYDRVNMRPGRAYKISWYAKAPSGSEALGKWLMAYLDFAGISDEGKVVYGGSQYQGIMSNDSTYGGVLTDEWQYYECYFKVKNAFITDFTKPNFYTRLVSGKGQSTGIANANTPYCIDEIKVEALDNPYNGSFNLPFTNTITTTRMGTFTPWIKGNNTTVSVQTEGGIPDMGSYIHVVQGANTQGDGAEANQQISSFVDIVPSEYYTLSFWAKYDSLPSGVSPDKANLQIVISKGMSGEYKYLNIPSITQDWKYYELTFQSTELQKSTQLVIRFLGGIHEEPASYCIDEIKLRKGLMLGLPTLVGTTAVGETLTVSVSKPSLVSKLIYRIMSSKDGIHYAGIKQGITTDGIISYNITENDIGKHIKVEFGGVTGTSSYTNLVSVSTQHAVIGKKLEFIGGWGSEIMANAVICDENATSGEYVGIIAQYNDEKELVKIKTYDNFIFEDDNKVTLSMSSVVDENAVFAKAFLWESLTSMKPVMESKLLAEKNYERILSFEAVLKKEVTYREVPELSDANTGIKAILYSGMSYKGQETEVFAYLGLPEGASMENKVPGMVLIHGGAGKAEKDWVKLWNDKGYAAIAFYWREAETYDGLDPNVDYVGGPRKNGYFADYLNQVQDQWMYHAVSDAILANTLLGSLPEVDDTRIGITGISWGGNITSYTIGIDSRFKFAAPVYGCGFLSEGSINKNLNSEQSLWDAKNVLNRTTVPILWVNSNIDAHFALDSTMLSYNATASEKDIYIVKDLGHGQTQGANIDTIFAYADSKLKGSEALVKASEFTISENQVSFKYNTQNELSAVRLVYNTTGILYSGTTSQTDWKEIRLSSSDFGNGIVNYTLPENTKGFYFELTDNMGIVTSTIYKEI